MKRIILLDIDGVLVQPGGYRAALRATVQRFVGEYPVEEDLLTELEKRGISSEWDMSPLIIAAYWEEVLSRQPMENLSDDVAVAAKQLQSLSLGAPQRLTIPEFNLVDGQYPAETAFHTGCFASISKALRKNLLTESRDARKSETFRVFQHYALGSKMFESVYQLPAAFEAESFLLLEDVSNVDPTILRKLRSERNFVAGFTARPSRPPREIFEAIPGYAPEAELALELTGLQDIPVMAFGKLEYIAARHRLDPASLIKPAPFHALAGILSAWTGTELPALQAVYDWIVNGRLNSLFKELPHSFEIMVVEDTMGGIRSARAAGDMLKDAGFDVNVRVMGITSGSLSKETVFRAEDVPWVEKIADIDF